MNKSKAKGTKFETEVVNHMHAKGLDEARRQVLTGNTDIGDIGGIPGWIVECKNVQNASWAAWMDETEVERRNAGAEFGLLIVRRRMAVIEKAYAVLPLSQAIRLIIDDIESR